MEYTVCYISTNGKAYHDFDDKPTTSPNDIVWLTKGEAEALKDIMGKRLFFENPLSVQKLEVISRKEYEMNSKKA